MGEALAYSHVPTHVPSGSSILMNYISGESRFPWRCLQYVVRLTEEQRQQLIALVSSGKTPAYKVRHAGRCGWPQPDRGPSVAIATRWPMLESDLWSRGRKNPYRPRLVDGEVEARIIALRRGMPAGPGAC